MVSGYVCFGDDFARLRGLDHSETDIICVQQIGAFCNFFCFAPLARARWK